MTSARFTNIHSCRKYVRSLRLDPYASAYELCDQMSSLRDRPIRVVEAPLPIPGPMGVWIARARDDVVVVQELATGTHRDHIVLHELAHILCGHEGEQLPDYQPEIPALETARGGPVGRLRSAYDSVCEREAELLAAAFAEQLLDDLDEEGEGSSDVHKYFAGS
ncbi:hypothetical protein ABT160_27215 [Streptomyces sp. NPDC001941]|uniref:hypothetical protein n=1 Tax=Streptomyces sp. NPDC001941 TaxID=3154659 RepID=UPI0033338BA4